MTVSLVEPPLLSVCMIVKNEAKNLKRALDSVTPLDADVVLVDTGSTDDTVAIARACGARVFHFAWVDDFSKARNFAFAHARGRWMLVLDADEEATPELRERIARALETSTADGIRVPVENLDAAGRRTQRMSSTRLVRNGRGHAYQNRVHEDVEAPILAAGGTLGWEELPIVHRGYTAEASRANGRSDRNLRLLRAAVDAEPTDPRHWHYLGLELAIAGETAQATRWFERVLTERPNHVLAGWSASQLAAIHTSKRAFGAAWDAAIRGSRARLGKISARLTLGELAVREGDSATAMESVAVLTGAPPAAEGDVADRTLRTHLLRARAVALRDPREALSMLGHVVMKEAQEDALAGDTLVRIAERLAPDPSTAILRALEAAKSPAVLAGGIGCFLRARAFAAAASLGEKYGLRNEAYAWSLAHVGRQREAAEVLASFGESSATHLLLLGLALRDRAVAAQGLAWSPPAWASIADRLFKGEPLDRDAEATVNGWLAIAAEHRADDLAKTLAMALPLSLAAREARLAITVLEAGEPMRALPYALRQSDEPDARQVLGLVAYERNDPAAAPLLALRVRDGDAPVHVVLAACASLAAAGQHDEARAILHQGRAGRPHSLALEGLDRQTDDAPRGAPIASGKTWTTSPAR